MSETCSACGHPCVPGAWCGIEDPKPASTLAQQDPPPRRPLCPHGLVQGRIGVIGRELSGRPVLVLPGDPRAPE